MSGTKHDRALEAAKSAYASHYHSGGMEAAIAAYHRVMREPDEGEVRVRVCVAVTETAGWQAYGSPRPGERAKNGAYFAEDAQYHFMEGNIPAWRPPAEETVEGEVVG